MSKPRLNMLVLTIFVLFSASCSQQKIILSGVIHNRTDHSSELLEAKLLRDNETKSGRRYKNSAVGPDGSFQMKIKPERSYILEISGDEGYGRVFLPAECLGEKIDISYPVKETIVIFHTNDRHFDFNHEDELVRTIEEARARYNDVFLFEAGDIFVRHASRWTVNDGQPNDTAWYGERALQLVQKMNDLGYDVMTLGNHELAYIKNYTRQALDAARFPILAANMQINTDKLPQPKPFTILNTSTGNHITVLGLSYDNSKRNGVKELDLNETVNKYLPSKNSAAINLVLSHIGLEKDLLLAGSFPQFDAIIGGHSHSLLEIPILENSVLIAQAGGNPHTMSDKNPAYLGKLIFTLENGKLIDKKGFVTDLGRKKDLSAIQMPVRGVCAHRGAMETHPENTVIAFREAVRAGAHMIEFDVQLTKDNRLVVLHDATVDRTTNGSGKVSELTFDEIRKLDAGSWKSPEFKGLKIPTFEEVLDEMPVNVWLNIHLKGAGETSKMVAEILKKEGRLHQAFLACGEDAARQARSVVPEIKICNMDRQGSGIDYVNNTIKMDADFIQLTGKITPEFADYAKALKERGIGINYFGTDIPEEISTLYNYGIDFPLVNNVIQSIHVAKEAGFEPVKPVF